MSHPPLRTAAVLSGRFLVGTLVLSSRPSLGVSSARAADGPRAERRAWQPHGRGAGGAH
jgi:hypothetical protein